MIQDEEAIFTRNRTFDGWLFNGERYGSYR
jgi:hypothetical protein